MLFRSFTEAPFVSSNTITTEFFTHLLVLVACVGFLPARQAQPAVKTFVPRASGGYASYAASRKAVP
jgi:hypothetical protein